MKRSPVMSFTRLRIYSVLLTWEYYNSNENIPLCGRTTHESYIRAIRSNYYVLDDNQQRTSLSIKCVLVKICGFLLELRRHQGSENRIYLLLRKRTLMFAACSHTLFFIHDHKFIYCVSVQKKYWQEDGTS